MKMIAGAILILAAAVLFVGGGVCEVIFARTLTANGGNLFYFFPDYARLSAICATVLEAGREIGLEYREDLNDLPPGHKDCIGWCQQTRGGRRRASAARTYLHPALKRPNLQLVTHALVHRVLFDGKRAVGVEFSRGGLGVRDPLWRVPDCTGTRELYGGCVPDALRGGQRVVGTASGVDGVESGPAATLVESSLGGGRGRRGDP